MNGIPLRELPSCQLAALSASYYAQGTGLHYRMLALPTSLCADYAILLAAAQDLRELIHEINEVLAERTARHG